MWLDEVRFDERGLVPVIAQSVTDGRVLMLAWADREALERTASGGLATYFSRSRGRLWTKGESSGNQQRVRSIRLDCDGDAVIYEVEQVGGAACHTGHASCFYRRLEDDRWRETDPVVRDPDEMYRRGQS